MLNVEFLWKDRSPGSRKNGCCLMKLFILTRIGRRVHAFGASVLQGLLVMVELSWVTMADLIRL